MSDRQAPIAIAISALASARREEREVAAAEIFRIARESAEPIVREWARDPEFARFSGAPAFEFTAGLAVETELFASIRAANGMPPLSSVPPEQDVLEFHLKFGAEARLEILTPRDVAGEGAVARFLRKFGNNIQHVEIATSDVDRAAEIVKSRFALQPIYPQTRAGADGARINFFLVEISSGKKILIELEESPVPRRSL